MTGAGRKDPFATGIENVRNIVAGKTLISVPSRRSGAPGA